MDNNKLKKLSEIFKPEKLFIRALTAWIISCFIVSANSTVIMTDKAFLSHESVLRSVLLTLGVFVLLNVLNYALHKRKTPKLEYESVLLLLCAVIYFSYCVMLDSNVYLVLALCLVASLCCIYALEKNKSLSVPGDIQDNLTRRTVIHFFAVSSAVLLIIGVFRCLTFSAPNYDLGIFANTAYNLKTKLIQYNTCERDMLITHFQVHVSPILYIVTPFYFLFPSAITLQVIQALAVASSVIPLYLICKNRRCSNVLTVALCFMAAFYPALSTGTFYDFHENVFLPALILWMIYFYEKEKNIPMFVFAVLTLCVKEDASIYVAFFGLFLMTQKGKRLKGLLLSALGVAYVLVCIWYINKYGFGAMTGRFKDYITDERLGLISLAANVILDPVYVIKNCIDQEKLAFVLQVMGPLLFLPLLTKKYSRYILLGPFILMNLMPSYQYQHSIFFQYLYGVIPLLMYLTAINAAELSPKTKTKVISCCICITAICYCAFVIPKTYYLSKYFETQQDCKNITAALDTIPDRASVSASTFYVPYLANRDKIYENEYTDKPTEYIVFDLRYAQEREEEMKIDLSRYELVTRYNDLVAVYKIKT